MLKHILFGMLMGLLVVLAACTFPMAKSNQITTYIPPPTPTPQGPGEQPVSEPGFDKVIRAVEGELVSLDVTAYDPDGDLITLTYTAPFDANGQWQTAVGDAGTYTVLVSASDGSLKTQKKIHVLLAPKNRAPIISPIPDVRIHIGDTLRFEPVVTDPEGALVTVQYAGWMDGNQKTATAADLGAQLVTITASDGELENSQVVTITVLPENHAPVLAPMGSITVSEGDTITLAPLATDVDSDPLTLSYSGWMMSATYTTTYDDAGIHEVIVTASDGDASAVQKVQITVKDRPRAPEIVIG